MKIQNIRFLDAIFMDQVVDFVDEFYC